MRNAKSLTNRLIALTLSIFMVLGMLPTGVFSVENDSVFATVESLTAGVTINETGKEVKASFAGNLTWVAKDPAIGRNEDGWWVGLKVIAPDTLDINTAKYKQGEQEKLFKDYRDSADDAAEQYITLWGLVKEAYLRSANRTDGLSTYSWDFDWDGDNQYEQRVVLDIVADRTVLYNTLGEQVYPFAFAGYGTAAPITPGASVSTVEDTTTITYDSVVLEWSAKDPSIGRMQDGWWVGMQITAPAQMTEITDFTEVTYQRYESGGWSEAKNFWNAQDSDKNAADTARYLTMWGVITPEYIANDNDGVLSYQYRFDWNQDGIYEQSLILQVKTDDVKLMKNGIQQYPLRYGVVDSLTDGGAVSGSESADSVVRFENITLNWSAKDPAAGRVADGWWVGAKITAPAELTKASDFAGVTYQRYENGAWSSAKSFWNAQDSDKNAEDTARYLTVWGLVDPELIAKDNDGVLTYDWRFDWNQDGEYEQTLTVEIDAAKVILLDKDGVQVYPTLGTVTMLTNGTVTGNGTGKTTARIENVQLEWAPKDESVGRVQDGWWTGMKVTAPAGTVMENAKFRRKGSAEPMAFVPDGGSPDTMQLWGLVTAEYLTNFSSQSKNINYTWEFDWNGDGVFEQTVTMTVVPAGIKLKQKDFGFAVDNDTVTYSDNQKIYTIIAPTGGQSQATPVYSIGATDVATLNADGTLTIHKAGTVTITATLGGDFYEDISDSYTLIIQKADQPDFGFANAPATLTWQAEELNALALVGGLGEGELTWSIKGDSGVAEVSADGKLTLLKAGIFTLTVQKAGDDCYNASAVVETDIEILRAPQTGFGFGETDKVTVTYNDNNNEYTLPATGGQSAMDVVYEVVSGDAATVNEFGVVSIKKSGVVVIKATKPADSRYQETFDTYELTIQKADQSFVFENDKSNAVKYGAGSFETLLTVAPLNSGNLSFTVSENTIGASVDSKGLVTFVDSADKVGVITVTATLAGDDCYNSFSDSYTITVTYEQTPATPYTLMGDKLIPGSDWFTGDVSILAPNGYQISYSNKLADNTWGNSVVWNEDGCADTWTDAPVVYLKNMETGAITDAIAVSDLKRDTVAPFGLSINYEVSLWATIGEKLFGIAPSSVNVTVKAEDAMSGISKLEYSLDGGKNYTQVDDNKGAYEFTVAPEYRGQLYLKATDVAGNEAIYKHLEGNTEKILVVDSLAPGMEVGYAGTMDDAATDGIRYVKGNSVTIVFEVSDENFDLREFDPVVTVNGEEISGWVFDNTTGKLTFTLTDEDDYLIHGTFTDRLGRTVTYDSEVRIDRTKPVIETDIIDGNYYTADQTFTVTITEHNFDASKVNLVISGVNSKHEALLSAEEIKAFADMAKSADSWVNTPGTDVYTLQLPIAKDANYTVQVDCADVLEQAADTCARTFALDKVDPNQPVLTYEVGTAKKELLIKTILSKLFGFAKETVTVTVQSGDAVAGIDYLGYKLHDEDTFTTVQMDKDGKYSFELDPQYRGKITVVVYDKAGRSATTVEQKEIVVDNIAPEVEISFAGNRQAAVKQDMTGAITREDMNTFDATTRFIYNGDVTATITVKEANFFPDNGDMTVQITRDNAAVTDLAAAGITDSGWVYDDVSGIYTKTITMTADGDYRVIVRYADHSENDMNWISGEYGSTGTYTYESNTHTIDTTAPVYEVTYDNNTPNQEVDGREYYAAARTATITVTDRNFRPDAVSFKVGSEDVTKTPVEFTYSQLTSWNDWTPAGENVWQAIVPFTPDANYEVSFAYTDLAGHQQVNTAGIEEGYQKKFTVDTAIPTDLKVVYQSKDSQVLNKILNTITFGNYKAGQEVVLTIKDATADIDYIALTVTPEGPASATKLTMPQALLVNADGTVKSGSKGFIGNIDSQHANGELTLTFDVPAQFRGKVSFVAYDKSGNFSGSHEDPGVLVVDTIAPGHTVSYNPANVVNVSDMKDMTGFDASKGIADLTDTDAVRVMYFNTDAVATIVITEANFYADQVKIEVLDADGEKVENWTQSSWTTNDNVHTTTVTIADEGDYQIKVYYQDYSMNTPVDYLSQWIVVDKSAPVIDVKYANTDVKNTIDGRDYFSAAQTATITVKEHNFRADDVVIKVTAKDVLGADVLTLNADGTVKAYADQGADRKGWSAYKEGTWRRTDDTYVITLNYTTDANYTFDIEYQDLAKNKAADYAEDLFTVDVTAPENLTVKYSTSVLEQIKESITFGYYNAKMTVTITAEDDTSGIYHFAYSYIKGKDVSGVNAELLDQAIKEAEITYEGKKATAKFEIPKLVLGNDNQFNGTVEFHAYDRSEVSTELKDTTRIIVDNISPTAKITYNAPVQTANGISYYAGNINASIAITEANFDAADVVVTVTKDGAAYPVNVTWKDDSVDLHTGTFTLTKDGDYFVSVQYKDKSGNEMASYTSNELTLDATKPVIKVSNIKANSANKDEKYGFTITFSDTNMDASALKPALKVVKQNASGAYEIAQVDLGKATTVVAGQTYTYTVEDLPDDGLYTLTCEVKDMSANAMAQVVLEDGESYEQVQFSINRKGSVFAYGDSFAEELVKQYYVYSVTQDVVIVEVNVDPIETYKVTLNGKELTEGTDYTTQQTSNEGEWSKRTYTIKKSLFEAEGEYSIIVTSTDKATTTAFSDVKNLSMAFVVDQTKPVITITGMETGGRYQTNEQTVTLIPTDEGGRLNSLTVTVLDSDGNPMKDDSGNDISVRFTMSGEELLKYLRENDGKITFTVPEGLNNQVKIICNDCAINDQKLTNEYSELFEKVTVSQNRFVIFYANTPAFVGTIAGIVAVAGLVVFLIKRKGVKKEKADK